MKWGPVYRDGAVDSLVTNEGYFCKDSKTFERQADPVQVRHELIAQIKMALQLGVNLTHADNHMGSLYGLQTGRDFLKPVLEVCANYGLPFRLPRNLLLENGQLAPAELASTPESMQKRLIGLEWLFSIICLDCHSGPSPMKPMTALRFK